MEIVVAVVVVETQDATEILAVDEINERALLS